MPVGTPKNLLYGLALPVLGKRCQWRTATRYGGGEADLSPGVTHALRQSHVVGGCVQIFRGGALAEGYCAGFASLAPRTPVQPGTLFRTASVAKLACALLMIRLQTLGRLNVDEDISALWGEPIRNPHFPDEPIPLSALLSHTSGMVDSERYFQGFAGPVPASTLLSSPDSFAPTRAGERFRYSNFAAGLIGCLLERRFGESLEALAQRELFIPLGARATFDLRALADRPPADSYRAMPAGRASAFAAAARAQTAAPLDAPDPQAHYLLASGSLYLTAEALARLCLPLVNEGRVNGDVWLSPEALLRMKTPVANWPGAGERTRHGLGLLVLEDPQLSRGRLYGHQGIAYGAVNGVFFNDRGDGFASLNSGASERRQGHLACLNRDLIRLTLTEATR